MTDSNDWFQKSLNSLSLNGKAERTQEAYTPSLTVGPHPEAFPFATNETARQLTGLLEQRIETTLRVVSILMG